MICHHLQVEHCLRFSVISLMKEVFLVLALLVSVRERRQVAIKALLQFPSWLSGWQCLHPFFHHLPDDLTGHRCWRPKHFSRPIFILCVSTLVVSWNGRDIKTFWQITGKECRWKLWQSAPFPCLFPSKAAWWMWRIVQCLCLHILLYSLTLTLLYRCHLYELLYTGLLDTTLSFRVGGVAVTLLKERLQVFAAVCVLFSAGPFQFFTLHCTCLHSPFTKHSSNQSPPLLSNHRLPLWGSKNQYNTKQ